MYVHVKIFAHYKKLIIKTNSTKMFKILIINQVFIQLYKKPKLNNTKLTSTIQVPHLCFPLQLVHLDTERYTLIPFSTNKSLIFVPPENKYDGLVL